MFCPVSKERGAPQGSSVAPIRRARAPVCLAIAHCVRLGGFTLLELLVVMVIIGLLASYVAPRFFNQVGKSEIKTARAQLDAFDKALAAYRLDTGRYPATEQGLRALTDRPSDEPRWSGPYLAKALPPDPWGRAYVYRLPGDGGREFEMFSYGKDGQAGGSGDNADISVWDTGH